MKKSILYIVFSILLLAGSPAFATDTVREVLMQNAVAATGNGTPVTVDYFTTISVEVTITNTATITWEESITGLNWNTGSCVNASAPGTIVTTATTSGLYHCAISALTKFRARVSSWTSGTVTAYARQTLVSFDVIRASSFPSSLVVTQSTGTNLHIVCDSGCSASSFDGIIRDGTGDTTQANVTNGRLNVDGSGVVSSANNDGACPSGAANTTALASNASRRAAYIAASPANTDYVFLKLGATATSSDFRLAPGQAFNIITGSIYTGIIDFFPASGTQAVCVAELN